MIISFITTILTLYAWYFLAGRNNGLMDTISHHWDRAPSRLHNNPSFWDPTISWVRKWKLDNTFQEIIPVSKSASRKHHWWYLRMHTPKYVERFAYSSTFLVFLTDGWHRLKSGMIIYMCLGAGMAIILPFTSDWWVNFAAERIGLFINYPCIPLVIHIILCRLAFGIGFATRYR